MRHSKREGDAGRDGVARSDRGSRRRPDGPRRRRIRSGRVTRWSAGSGGRRRDSHRRPARRTPDLASPGLLGRGIRPRARRLVSLLDLVPPPFGCRDRDFPLAGTAGQDEQANQNPHPHRRAQGGPGPITQGSSSLRKSNRKTRNRSNGAGTRVEAGRTMTANIRTSTSGSREYPTIGLSAGGHERGVTGSAGSGVPGPVDCDDARPRAPGRRRRPPEADEAQRLAKRYIKICRFQKFPHILVVGESGHILDRAGGRVKSFLLKN